MSDMVMHVVREMCVVFIFIFFSIKIIDVLLAIHGTEREPMAAQGPGGGGGNRDRKTYVWQYIPAGKR